MPADDAKLLLPRPGDACNLVRARIDVRPLILDDCRATSIQVLMHDDATRAGGRALGAFLASDMKDRFGASHARLAELVPFAARLALECIGNSDALYHNVEHTMLVTLAGHDIFKGRALLLPSTPSDYSNFIVACLTHDIGYVRGVVKGDGDDGYVVDAAGHKVSLPRGCSDAALAPYHVDRSKLFVLDRVAQIDELDGPRIARAIEFTRFPYPAGTDESIDEEGSLLRAADLIGQLGDPHYLRKSNALYYEFEESGLNKEFGYRIAGGPRG
jgi:hypothetical protein